MSGSKAYNTKNGCPRLMAASNGAWSAQRKQRLSHTRLTVCKDVVLIAEVGAARLVRRPTVRTLVGWLMFLTHSFPQSG